MPRPVLSETTFNSDNIATSILQQANLQITSNQLGVTDITSEFVRNSNWDQNGEGDHVFHFNGFVFYNLGANNKSSFSPSNGNVVWNIGSDYHPSNSFQTNTSTHQGDTTANIVINTSGEILIGTPFQPSGSDSALRIIINGWYRI